MARWFRTLATIETARSVERPTDGLTADERTIVRRFPASEITAVEAFSSLVDDVRWNNRPLRRASRRLVVALRVCSTL